MASCGRPVRHSSVLLRRVRSRPQSDTLQPSAGRSRCRGVGRCPGRPAGASRRSRLRKRVRSGTASSIAGRPPGSAGSGPASLSTPSTSPASSTCGCRRGWGTASGPRRRWRPLGPEPGGPAGSATRASWPGDSSSSATGPPGDLSPARSERSLGGDRVARLLSGPAVVLNGIARAAWRQALRKLGRAGQVKLPGRSPGRLEASPCRGQGAGPATRLLRHRYRATCIGMCVQQALTPRRPSAGVPPDGTLGSSDPCTEQRREALLA